MLTELVGELSSGCSLSSLEGIRFHLHRLEAEGAIVDVADHEVRHGVRGRRPAEWSAK